MTKKSTSHIVFHPQKPNTVYCQHCGATQPIPSPCSINVFRAIGKAFTQDHRNCKPEPEVAAADAAALAASFKLSASRSPWRMAGK